MNTSQLINLIAGEQSHSLPTKNIIKHRTLTVKKQAESFGRKHKHKDNSSRRIIKQERNIRRESKLLMSSMSFSPSMMTKGIIQLGMIQREQTIK